MSSSSDYNSENQQQAPSFHDGNGVHRSGPLMQLSGKGLLHSGSWKRRYCVLDSQRLFYYPVKESQVSQIEDSERGGSAQLLPPLCYREKTSHYVDLECYDICEEVAIGKDQRTNVIVLSSTDIENSFFETGRVYLSAETSNEMNEWISQIRSVMTAVRSGGAGGGGEGTSSTRVTNPTVKSPPTTPVKKRPAPAKPIDSAIAVVASVANNTLISSTTTSTTTTVATGKKKSSDGVTSVDTMTTLDCNMAKQRAKGPTGRRLPRQVQSRLFPSSQQSHSFEGDHLQAEQKRSESLPRLEMDQSLQRNGRQQQKQQAILRQAVQHNRSLDVVIQQQQPRRATSTIYAYSSSDDDESLNVSFIPTTNDDDGEEEEEEVETLCEVALPHAVSTPSLAVAGGNPFSSWQMIGSSSSTPRPVARAAKQRHNLLRSSGNGGASALASGARGGGSSSTDDPPGLYHLMQQTSAMRATLSSLEADFVASRRDVGWLQENLSTVQSSAASVSDKVVKMQSQVTGMERQISATVKVSNKSSSSLPSDASRQSQAA